MSFSTFKKTQFRVMNEHVALKKQRKNVVEFWNLKDSQHS